MVVSGTALSRRLFRERNSTLARFRQFPFGTSLLYSPPKGTIPFPRHRIVYFGYKLPPSPITSSVFNIFHKTLKFLMLARVLHPLAPILQGYPLVGFGCANVQMWGCMPTFEHFCPVPVCPGVVCELKQHSLKVRGILKEYKLADAP